MSDTKPIRWWNWRRRTRRLAYLEMIVQTQIRIHLDGAPRLGMTLEGAYEHVVHGGTSDQVRGLAFLDVVSLRASCAFHEDSQGPEVVISLRAPLQVGL